MARIARIGGLVAGLLAALAAATLWAQGRPLRAGDPPVRIEVTAQPIAQFSLRPSPSRQFGALQFRGGMVLKSTSRDFGGISSFRLERDGARFLAVTDKGNWLRGRVTYQNEVPAGIDDAEMAPMLGPDGRTMRSRRWYDAESLALDGERAFVGFERVHRIAWFDMGRDGLQARGQPMKVPDEFSTLPSNGGIEGLVAVPQSQPLGGALLAFSERGLDEAGNIKGFIIGGPSPGRFTVRRSDDFDITDAAITPAGDVLILERKFSVFTGPGMRVRKVPLAAIAPGAVVDGPVLIVADAGFQIDNMEGLSVHRGSAGETVVTMVSDDNFSALQRTLLLQFTLVEP